MKQTNFEYSKTNIVFKKSCAIAGTPVTTRQASKYRRGLGLAYNARGLKGSTDRIVAMIAKDNQCQIDATEI